MEDQLARIDSHEKLKAAVDEEQAEDEEQAAVSADEPEEIAYIDLVSDSASEDEAEDDETEDDETGDALSPTLQKRMERYTERLVVLPGTRTENLSLAAVRACIASSNFKRRRVF